MVQFEQLQLVCIAGYCLYFSFKLLGMIPHSIRVLQNICRMIAPFSIVPSTALTSDDLDTPRAPVEILLFVAVLLIYGRTFYSCS